MISWTHFSAPIHTGPEHLQGYPAFTALARPLQARKARKVPDHGACPVRVLCVLCRQVRQILAEADENEDNVIQYKEFLPVMVDILQSIKVNYDHTLSHSGFDATSIEAARISNHTTKTYKPLQHTDNHMEFSVRGGGAGGVQGASGWHE